MKIEYWSDIACPYCYIGKARLDKTLQKLNISNSTEIKLKSFPLARRASKDFEQSFIDHLTNNNESLNTQAIKQMKYIENLAKHEGLAMNIFNARFVNTLDAHRLIKAAQNKNNDIANYLIKKLYEAFFVNGKNIAKRNVLISIGKDAGFSEQEVENILDSDLFLKEVNEEKLQARKLNVQALPYFIINDKYVINGLQKKQKLEEILAKSK
ncbi:DsbA family oxidoreductase [Lactobacillus sp. PSON]|uniref:DsbA family oxidoreductase n=1 Tax=Lactobacillus sp. PSON TaxID=3455454 RepID=UPI00404252C7